MEGDWKLIRYHEDGRDELYDLGADPGEQIDLAEVQNGQVLAMRPTLEAWLRETEARMPTPYEKFDETKRAARWANLSTAGKARLEKQHANFLNASYKPNKDWWGSGAAVAD